MSAAVRNPQPTTLDSIKRSLVALRMPRALEVLDQAVRRIEQGEIDAIGALDQILIEELSIRENRRIKTALLLARLIAPRWCICSARPARAKAISPRRSPWRR